jgi:hypothetical protein
MADFLAYKFIGQKANELESTGYKQKLWHEILPMQ